MQGGNITGDKKKLEKNTKRLLRIRISLGKIFS